MLNSKLSLKELAAFIDHTILKPDATLQDIDKLCDEAMTHSFKGVCVNPRYIRRAASRLAQSQVLPVTVVGFPLGACRTDIKIDETLRAVGDGAKEVDMVIALGPYLSREVREVRYDIEAVIRAADKVPVKVIFETGFLTADNIRELTTWCGEAGAAFVKTSTGFGPRGASFADVETMLEVAAAFPKLQIKASGGIRDLATFMGMVDRGATRIGTSSGIALLHELSRC